MDFNRPTEKHSPPSPERHEQIMHIVRAKMNIKPYRPLHFVDAIAAETPLNTSASYYSKFNPESRIYARHSAPLRYADRPSSKGHHFNVVMNTFRHEVHHIKYDGLPFPSGDFDPEAEQSMLETWMSKHPSQLFIRTQISKRDPHESKKIRPVYSVDDRFLHIEKMLTTNALAQLRNPESCVAHGLETFRGATALINRIALSFLAFISLDWSQFDQRLPRYVIVSFYLDYLPSLLIISNGYFPSRYYSDTTQPVPEFASKIFNLLIFLTTWYLSMTFLSYDGFAYIRRNGGVPSGLLNTQLLDSFGNMYIITDCLLEFGFTTDDCLQMLFLVMGDDNLIFLNHNFSRVCQFMEFLSVYALSHHGMALSILKSVYSTLANKISFLSYTNDNGMPTRPLGKLVAQLAFPERPIPADRTWMHSARALGLAYASCGQDPLFYHLCKMVYDLFRPAEALKTLQVEKVLRKLVHTGLEFDLENDEFHFPDFPTLAHIRSIVSTYHGPFSEEDKWNTNLFNVPPSDNLDTFTTLKDFISSDERMSLTVDRIRQG